MTLKLVADRELCIGAGQCLVAASNLDLDGENKVRILGEGSVADADLGDVRNAVEMCPTEALSLQEVDPPDGDRAQR